MSRQNDLRRKWFGGKWIRPERRLALHIRDGFACLWCRRGVEEDGVRLSLDHLKTNRDGGGNESANLVTCCYGCNSKRAHKSLAAWARVVAEWWSTIDVPVTPAQVVRAARAQARREVPLAEAKRIIVERTKNGGNECLHSHNASHGKSESNAATPG